MLKIFSTKYFKANNRILEIIINHTKNLNLNLFFINKLSFSKKMIFSIAKIMLNQQ